MLQLKRIYDSPENSDGYRVLVDRLWPRAMSKERAAIDTWLKDIAPSSELREWYSHDPTKFQAFRERYFAELRTNPALHELQQLMAEHDNLTLLYAAKDELMNNAVVLKAFLGL